MKNEDQFKSNLVAVGEVFSKEVSPALAKIYWRSLSQFTDNQVQAAFDRAVTNLKFFPTAICCCAYAVPTGSWNSI